MLDEDTLQRYTKPSSNSEKSRQDAAIKLLRGAVDNWSVQHRIQVSLYPKGSYANNTNVRLDSDVDIAVVYKKDGMTYYKEERPNPPIHHPASNDNLKRETFRHNLGGFLKGRFGADCDNEGNVAIKLFERSEKISVDVVPSFVYQRYYLDSFNQERTEEGHIIFDLSGDSRLNYPQQQYDNEIAKRSRTDLNFKKIVRIIKRMENDLVEAEILEKALPSYFVESLVYNAPDADFKGGSLKLSVSAVTKSIVEADNTWVEPNEIQKLFRSEHNWTVEQARDFGATIFSYLWS